MIGLLISCFERLFLWNFELAELKMKNIAMLHKKFKIILAMISKNASPYQSLEVQENIATMFADLINFGVNGRYLLYLSPISLKQITYFSTHRKDIKLHTRREEHCCCEKHGEEAINYVRSLYDRR